MQSGLSSLFVSIAECKKPSALGPNITLYHCSVFSPSDIAITITCTDNSFLSLKGILGNVVKHATKERTYIFHVKKTSPSWMSKFSLFLSVVVFFIPSYCRKSLRQSSFEDIQILHSIMFVWFSNHCFIANLANKTTNPFCALSRCMWLPICLTRPCINQLFFLFHFVFYFPCSL